MSTRVREFRTVKSAEFYPNAQFILDPALIPKHDEITKDEERQSSDISQ